MPLGPPFQPRRFCFTPTTLLSFSPSGPFAVRRSSPVSETVPPVPSNATLWRRVRLRRVNPSAKRPQLSRNSTEPCPPGVLPSEALSLTAVGPASRPLLSRALPVAGLRTVSDAAPFARLRLRVLPCGEHGFRFGQRERRPPRHRPLWGSSPRRFYLHPWEPHRRAVLSVLAVASPQTLPKAEAPVRDCFAATCFPPCTRRTRPFEILRSLAEPPSLE